jgi:hypothetical protein
MTVIDNEQLIQGGNKLFARLWEYVNEFAGECTGLGDTCAQCGDGVITADDEYPSQCPECGNECECARCSDLALLRYWRISRGDE